MKLLTLNANAAQSPPAIIMQAPNRKPFRLPALPMYTDMGIATMMPEKICIEAGSVANACDGASDCPASTPSRISIGMGAPRTMLDVTMSRKLRVMILV